MLQVNTVYQYYFLFLYIKHVVESNQNHFTNKTETVQIKTGYIFLFLLYARLKNGTYYVTGYGVRPSVRKLFRFRLTPLQFTSDQAETWYIVRP